MRARPSNELSAWCRGDALSAQSSAARGARPRAPWSTSFVAKARDPRKPESVVPSSVIGMNTVNHRNALIDDALAKGR